MTMQQRELFNSARRIFLDHSYTLEPLANGRFIAVGVGPWGGDVKRFGSLVSAVDWAKPIFADSRLDGMYV